ncbi:hypothetical protein NECAME_06763 [Necator americanus]|uniref:Exoribonuclease phosphorolytic domain-containing protein n=1 Tax=Necator americanus TaxID=51031 RepID=W2TSM3_NECAM|nr:hypothetical protein NECAME_06763 [Necator americanus]ETN84664.1 hypothetical protein NECAME_06763 [Necator americanus]
MHLDVSYRQLTGDCQYHWLNNVIRTTLESVLDPKVFPRTGFTVTTQLLQSDGSEGAAALTSVCLAMLDNGISIRYYRKTGVSMSFSLEEHNNVYV